MTLAGQLPEKAVPAVKDFVEELKYNWAAARANMEAAQAAQSKVANRRRRAGVQFVPGDLVLISTKDTKLENEGCKKFRPRWFGPLEVVSAK